MTDDRPPQQHGDDVDLVIVGAGFAGMYMLHRARGLGLSTRVFEAGTDVGGTWYWNRYPGARCDTESVEYSYSFDPDLQQEWEWTERYATQPEILRYAQHVADRFDLRRDVAFGTKVLAAHYDEAAARWAVTTDRGDAVSTRFVVMATGSLSSANLPDFDGIHDYAGRVLHTGRWPHEPVDFIGERVAVIGTGSSAIQSIPLIAQQAEHLTVFQRTPNYAIPAHNRPLDPDEAAAIKARYDEFRAENRAMTAAFGARWPANDVGALAVSDDDRRRMLEERWELGGLPFLGAFNDILLDASANEVVAEFVRDKIRAVVADPVTAATLTPTNRIGCKRLCVDTDYFATFNRPNVELVDINAEPIERFTASGVVAGGAERTFDTVVLATGFDAMTGTLLRIDIRGRDAVSLGDVWAEGPITQLGLQVPGFPNLFMVNGPGSPSVLTNMIVSIEHHVGWIADTLAHLQQSGRTTIEADPDAAEQWGGVVDSIAQLTLLPSCNSWYRGANIPGKPVRFMPFLGFPMYTELVAQSVADGYRGFVLA